MFINFAAIIKCIVCWKVGKGILILDIAVYRRYLNEYVNECESSFIDIKMENLAKKSLTYFCDEISRYSQYCCTLYTTRGCIMNAIFTDVV